MLKTSTKQLIESFKLRDIKPQCIRNDVAHWHRWVHNDPLYGRQYDIAQQLILLGYRKHLATLKEPVT